jgi:CRISPR/Cas system-associated exonuclease Cas4 (RecB family)
MNENTFLEYVAEDIIKKYGTDLSNIAVVFPNKRASLFLNEYLLHYVDKPMWSPAYITISDLFRSHTSLTVADPLKLVCDLHKIYLDVTGINESLDRFFGWGQLMISDFDDIDKNMADADKVFSNVKDIHEMDDISYLTDEQIESLEMFFEHVSGESELKKKFFNLWNNLSNIYHAFNDKLIAEGITYEGALYRSVIEDKNVEFKYDKYLFVGFNVLQKVEQQLFSTLKKQGKAAFYWDFDSSYMRGGHEAGRYISKYLADFPNEFDIDNDSLYNNFVKEKSISFISATTENIQARFVADWLNTNNIEADRRTAIVMCNEGVLPTIIHSLPSADIKVNITTGYPLAQSPIASLLSQLLALQINGFTKDGNIRKHYAVTVLKHPYVKYITSKSVEQLVYLMKSKVFIISKSDIIDDVDILQLFSPYVLLSERVKWLADILKKIAANSNDEDPFFRESVFRAYTLINRLFLLISSGDLDVDVITFQRLMNQIIASTTIPFHGEPVEGLQIMGVLETRNLDFENILILSANEEMMPKGVNDASFIPYAIRKGYGLTTVDNKVAIYAYYFYRMLQRARHITLVYNNSTEGAKRGEMSRFMLQMLVESGHDIRRFALSAGQTHDTLITNSIEKTDAVMDVLYKKFDVSIRQKDDALLTPTAINNYMKCPLAFYYKYVGGIDEPDEIEEGEVDPRTFGNIFHFITEQIYKPVKERGGRVTSDYIDSILKSPSVLKKLMNEAFCSQLFNIKDNKKSMPKLNGIQLINYNVIKTYVKNLLSYDKNNTPFDIVDIEMSVKADLTIHSTKEFRTTIGGRIDRLDCKDGRIRVIDYKTGTKVASANGVDDLFISNDKHTDYYLQTFLYSMIVSDDTKANPAELPVSPALLFIQHISKDDYDPTLKFGDELIADIKVYKDEYMEQLNKVITEIFDQSKPFNACDNSKTCSFCPYRKLCGHDKV